MSIRDRKTWDTYKQRQLLYRHNSSNALVANALPLCYPAVSECALGHVNSLFTRPQSFRAWTFCAMRVAPVATAAASSSLVSAEPIVVEVAGHPLEACHQGQLEFDDLETNSTT